MKDVQGLLNSHQSTAKPRKSRVWLWIICVLLVSGVVAALMAYNYDRKVKDIRRKMAERKKEVLEELKETKAKTFQRDARPGLVDGNAANEYKKLFYGVDTLEYCRALADWGRKNIVKKKWGRNRNCEEIRPLLDFAAQNAPDLKRIQNMRTVDWETEIEKGVDCTFPHIQKARRWTKILKVYRDYCASMGDWQNAAETTMIMMQLGADVGKDYCLVSLLVSISISVSAFDMKNAYFAEWDLRATEWNNIGKKLDIIYGEFRPVADYIDDDLMLV